MKKHSETTTEAIKILSKHLASKISADSETEEKIFEALYNLGVNKTIKHVMRVEQGSLYCGEEEPRPGTQLVMSPNEAKSRYNYYIGQGEIIPIPSDNMTHVGYRIQIEWDKDA